jgi:hypothetical protein
VVGESGSSDYGNRGDLPYFHRLSGCFVPSGRVLKSFDRGRTLEGAKRRSEPRSSLPELHTLQSRQERSRDEPVRLPAGPQLNIKPRRPPEEHPATARQFFISPYNALTTKLYNMVHKYAGLRRLSACLRNAPALETIQDETIDEVVKELASDKCAEEVFHQRIARAERRLARKI